MKDIYKKYNNVYAKLKKKYNPYKIKNYIELKKHIISSLDNGHIVFIEKSEDIVKCAIRCLFKVTYPCAGNYNYYITINKFALFILNLKLKGSDIK